MKLKEKLLTVKMQVPYIQKDKRGFNYTYTTPGQVLGVINPLLNSVKVILTTKMTGCTSQRIEIVSAKDGKIKYEWKYDLDILFTWEDVESDEKIEIPWKSSGVNGEEKGLGSALTYAERYFMLKQFNIPTDDDDPDSFQERHMTEEEKKARREEAARQAEADKREQAALKAERIKQEVAEAVRKLKNCNTVDELKLLKSILPIEIITAKDFANAATDRYATITTK